MKAVEQMASLLRLTSATIRSLLENEPPEAHRAIQSAAASVDAAAATLEIYVAQHQTIGLEEMKRPKYRN